MSADPELRWSTTVEGPGIRVTIIVHSDDALDEYTRADVQVAAAAAKDAAASYRVRKLPRCERCEAPAPQADMGCIGDPDEPSTILEVCPDCLDDLARRWDEVRPADPYEELGLSREDFA